MPAFPTILARAVVVMATTLGASFAPSSVDLRDDAFGISGALRVQVALPGERVRLPIRWNGERPADAWYRWVPVMGTESRPERTELDGLSAAVPDVPGVYALEVGGAGESRTINEMKLVVKVPFETKANGRLRGYSIGRYPTEGRNRQGRYATPAGFIEVTAANQNLPLSEHFTLREFLTHDQRGVWPKYAIVEPRLIEKLELVMAQLNEMGVPARRLVVMSGFRTPQYNRQGLSKGRAVMSRHQYGDAADVWVDNNGDNYMDDLNHDGRRDTGDVRVMLKAVERVESRYPELTGGAGVYRSNSAHGPFIHIDVRGNRARWGGAKD